MRLFNHESEPKRALRQAFSEARNVWQRAAHSGSKGLAEATAQADGVWTDTKKEALTVWEHARDRAEKGFHEALDQAEKAWRKSAPRKKTSSAATTAFWVLTIGAIVTAVVLSSGSSKDDGLLPQSDR